MQALHVILLALARDNIQVMMLTAADNAISEGMAPSLLNHSEKWQFIRAASCRYLPHLVRLPCLIPWRGWRC